MSLLLRSWLATACALPIVMAWALVIALVSRFRWKTSQWFLPMFSGPFLLLFVVLIEDVICGAPFQFQNVRVWTSSMQTHQLGLGSATPWTVAAVALVAHLLATFILPYFGLWRQHEGQPRAMRWPLKRLALCFAASVGLLMLTCLAQGLIINSVARHTIQQADLTAKDWRPKTWPGMQGRPDTTHWLGFVPTREFIERPFIIMFSCYQPLRNVPLRAILEEENSMTRLRFESLGSVLDTTPFCPKVFLEWDRAELSATKSILNAGRLATILAIEEKDSSQIEQYLNTMAVISNRLGLLSDADSLLVSITYAANCSALLERWLFEGSPIEYELARLTALDEPGFSSRREPMLRQLETTILYERAQTLLGKRPSNLYRSHLIVHRGADRPWDPTGIVELVLYGADDLLLAPKVFEKHRPRFIVPTTEFDDFGHSWTYSEWAGQSNLVWNVFPTFSTTCFALIREDARNIISNVGLQVYRYQLKHKQYPASLTDLVPEYLPQVPLDPFDGQPIRYLEHESRKGAVVYSVGGDRKDQQTDPGFKGDRNDSDIVFCLGDSYRQRRIPKPESR
jgi:hypothetical protein